MLNETTLRAQIEKQILINFKKALPSAKATPFQRELAQAIAKSFITSLKGAVALGATGTPAAGPSYGIQGVTAAQMAFFAMQKYKMHVQTVGKVLRPLLLGIYEPTILQLKQVQITTASGFGGPLLKILNLNDMLVSQQIINNLSASTRNNLLKSKYGKILIDAIAFGFVQNLTLNGIPSPLPMGPGTPGATVAKFS